MEERSVVVRFLKGVLIANGVAMELSTSVVERVNGIHRGYTTMDLEWTAIATPEELLGVYSLGFFLEIIF